MSKFKEVKQAWSSGQAIQFDTAAGWVDWSNEEMLDLTWHDNWRIKPETHTVIQWEVKCYDPVYDEVYTVYAKEKSLLNTMTQHTISEPREVKYYILTES